MFSITNSKDLQGVFFSIKNKEQKKVMETFNDDDIITVKGKISGFSEKLGFFLDVIEIEK